ncbi:MAG: single-stranded-DNA-specific exonuclease RecJ [Candidatus Latescibacterota bacterium]|nr:single-stranded-DNA-specific exonuclease RecJ [Candidatus Latescibacterota bacterium]
MRLYPVWNINHSQPYNSLVDALLKVRSLDQAELDVGPEVMHDPADLRDMDRAVERIVRAISQREKIVVYGDYDVDGVSSTAVMLDFLDAVGADGSYILPDRHVDGYGLKAPGVERAIGMGATLIITVDNGISAFDALELARERGVDVVVVDHHQQLDHLPDALAIVNPNRRDCPYPFKELAGVGVTFKLVQALSSEFFSPEERRRYLNSLLDLVVLGTVADVMPVLGENRVLVQRGLQILNSTTRPGLRQLKAVSGYAEKPVKTTGVGFHIGPRINVAGRLEKPDIALELIRADSDGQAIRLAEELNRLNARRQTLQREGMDEVEALVSREDLARDRIVVVLGEWKLGIIGLLASKLCEKHTRPAVVCSDDAGGGLYVGSARSVPAYNISRGIGACADHLVTYGGHPAAAGFSLKAASFEAFRLQLIEHANTHIQAEDLQAELDIDIELAPGDLDIATIECLAALEPFGNGNEAPLFAVRGSKVLSRRQIGKGGTHLKVELEVEGRHCNGLWWNQGDVADKIHPGQHVSVAFVLEEDTYAGGGAVQMVIKDMYLER